MQKRSHALLASALLRCEGGFSARRYELAFLFGSFQPDCNYLSYLKGSLHHKKFGGHTYGNNRRFLEKRIRRLQKREKWNLWHYYTLGKLCHYVADAFTYPHNDHFPGKGWDHHTYEVALCLRLQEVLAGKELSRRELSADLTEDLARLHRHYMSGASGLDRDIRYILAASELLMSGCRPKEAALAEEEFLPVPDLLPLPELLPTPGLTPVPVPVSRQEKRTPYNRG